MIVMAAACCGVDFWPGRQVSCAKGEYAATNESAATHGILKGASLSPRAFEQADFLDLVQKAAETDKRS